VADAPDDTDSQRRGRHWGADQRALVGQRRKITGARGSLVDGVPVLTSEAIVEPVEDDDRTPVFDRVDGPALTVEDGAAIMRALARVRRELEDRSDSDRRGMDEVRKLLAQPPPTAIVQCQADVAALRAEVARLRDAPGLQLDELHDKHAAMERDLAPIKRLGRWAAGIAFSALIAVGTFLYVRGTSEGGDRVRLERLQRDVEELQRDLRTLERHGSATPALPSSSPRGLVPSPDAISSANIKEIQ
jgi:hypothetical protein